MDPAFVLLSADFLKTQKAVYTGTVHDDIHGEVAAWSIVYQGVLLVTLFLDESNVVVRYLLYALFF